jgi:predicted HTH transcriptional regulator
MGGHVEYPEPTHCRFYFYDDRIEIENPDLVIPYNAIKNIENLDEE